jgi:hypothetical protein
LGVQQLITATPDVDVLIVGAGISGIGMAAHMQRALPGQAALPLSIGANANWRHVGPVPLSRRPFSDSDMHTLGFEFEPWRHEKSIADGPAILEYLDRIVDEREYPPPKDPALTARCMSADFDSAPRHVDRGHRLKAPMANTAGSLRAGSTWDQAITITTSPMKPNLQGREDFKGDVIHPQFWPEGLRPHRQARGRHRIGRNGGDDRPIDGRQGRARHPCCSARRHGMVSAPPKTPSPTSCARSCPKSWPMRSRASRTCACRTWCSNARATNPQQSKIS